MKSVIPSIGSSYLPSVLPEGAAYPLQLFSSGGATPALPESGLIGAWFVDEYEATPRKAIPNSVNAATARSPNLLRAPIRLFNNNDFYFKSGATVVDSATSSTVALAASDAFVYYADQGSHPVLPAGTYTMAVTVRRNAGSNQSFRMSFLHADVHSPTLTATSVDQRFTLTATVGSGAQGLLFVRTIDSSTAADLIVSDFQLFSGAADLGIATLAGHMYVGDSQYDARPVTASGVMDLTADGAYAITQFPSDLALESFTVVAVASKTENARNYNSILCEPNAQNDFGVNFDVAKTENVTFGGASILYGNNAIAAPDGYNPFSAGYRFIGHRYDNSTGVAAMYANQTRLLHTTGLTQTVPVSVNQLLVGAFSSNTLTGGYEINSIALYNRALSDAEMLQAYDALAARAASSSLTVTTASRYLVSVGDSITVDSTTPSYAHLFYANASPRCYGAIYGQSGGTLSVLVTQGAVIDGVLPADRAGQEYILSIMIGTNDLTGSSDVAGFLASLASFCEARTAAGWAVVLLTLLPNDRANFNSRRATANTGIRSWAGMTNRVAAICDVGANTTIGEDGDEANMTYYSDGVHPTLAGQNVIETVFRATVNAL